MVVVVGVLEIIIPWSAMVMVMDGRDDVEGSGSYLFPPKMNLFMSIISRVSFFRAKNLYVSRQKPLCLPPNSFHV